MSETPTSSSEYLETDEEEQERRLTQRKEELERERYIASLHKILNTYAGRYVLWEVLSLSGMFTAPPSHPQDTFRALGRADVGRDLILDIEECQADAFSRIYSEASKRLKEIDENG